MATDQRKKKKPSDLDPVKDDWGAQPEDNFGYTSEEERRANRGLEDWEMVDRMSDSQPGIFAWLHTVVGSVVAGVIVFAIFAFAMYYFTYHYGTVLFKNWHWF
ncbi:MAG: hypothetical protein P8164_15655 [Gammaproteobacteria bacterium]|jgi:hypothetical protein